MGVSESLKHRLLLLRQREWGFVAQKGLNYVIGLVTNLTIVWGFLKIASFIWPDFISKHKANSANIYIIITLAWVWLTHLLNILVYEGIDRLDLLPQYKITKTNLPWETNKDAWHKIRKRAILFNLLNIGLISPGLLILDSYDIRVNMSPSVPELPEVVTQLFFCMLVENALFYVLHRLSHTHLYRFHKVHHEIIVPCPIATNMFHPLDYFIGIVIPFLVGPKLLGSKMHYITYMLWTFWRVCDGYDGHCNYQIPWHPLRVVPFIADSQYHSYHHTHNIGNYGSCLNDTLGDTNQDYFNYKSARNQEIKAKLH